MRIALSVVVIFLIPHLAAAGALFSQTGNTSGVAAGESSHFVITDSDYLNVSLDSTEVIRLRIESVPRVVTMRLESVSDFATSTQITIMGLVPNTAYYKYEDNLHNLAPLSSDESGAYSYTQDISKPHLVFIQPRKSTKFIRNDATGGDCATMGTWDSATLTCTLATDVTETIQIDSDGVTLDGAGHVMDGQQNAVDGVYFEAKASVTVKNLVIRNFAYGIFVNTSSQSVFSGNSITNTIEAIVLDGSSSNTLNNNVFLNNRQEIVFFSSSNNSLRDNSTTIDTISSRRHQGIILFDSNNNLFETNSITMNSEVSPDTRQGILFFSSHRNTITSNTLSKMEDALIMYDSNDNKIYNNDFINNGTQVADYNGVGNIFSLASPEGGNYWDTFDEHAEGCDDADLDGFCDAPYSFTGGQDALPWTKQDGWKIPPAPKVSNVLFLPGIEASRLYRPDYNGGTDKLWEPNVDSDGNDLLLTADGKSVRNDVYTKDVIDEAYGVGPNIYKSFIDQMNGLKTAGTIADWEAVPYDWRLSLDDILNSGNQLPDGRIYYSGDFAATSSPYIAQELRRLAKSSKTGKVTIVAHSNGGLVTKALIEKLGSTEAGKLIDKIIFIAVPQAGTPQAIGALLHGYDQGLPKDWLSIFLSPSTARTLAENMSSAYNLLPSANYFTYVDNPVVTFDNSDFLAEFRARYGGNQIHDEAQLRNFITDIWRLASSSPSDLKYPSVGNATLLSRAEALHTTLDTWTPPQGISLYEVAGWGEDTLATIEYSKGKKAYCSNPWDIRTCSIVPTIIYNPKEVVEGDGTVLVPSALWSSASTTKKYWVDLMKYNTSFFGINLPSPLRTEHADILEVSELRTLINNLLTNSTSTLPRYITTTKPVIDVVADKRLRFVLHSPLNLSATDNLGNSVNSATSTIPGSRWKRYGEVQVLTVPEGTSLILNLDGYATGSFTLDMQEIDGSDAIIASSTFSAIPSATSTKATMAFTDGTIQNASPLLLDYDGNGTTDFSLTSKIGEAVVFDITPPEAILTFDPVSQQFKIVGTDNLSSTTVSTTATSTTITDEAGNTMQIVFKKLKQEGKQLKLEIQELRYNDVPAGEVLKTALQYEWSTDKLGKLKELEEKAMADTLEIDGHYDVKKNVTRIEEKIKNREDRDEKESKKTLSGLVVISLTTDNGKIGVSY